MEPIIRFIEKIVDLFLPARPEQDSAARPASQTRRETVGNEDSNAAVVKQRASGAAVATAEKPAGELTSAPTETTQAPSEWDPVLFQVPEKEGQTRFQDLDLPVSILHAVHDLSFQYCTPIQAALLPETLNGHDAFGKAQTGTGKTAAFLITIFSRLQRSPSAHNKKNGAPRALILAPTRELVMQIAAEALELSQYHPFEIVSVFGGMDYEKQRRQLVDNRVDVVIATPGRLLDFQRHKQVDLRQVEILVIDEADRMLDMGFIPDVRRIIYSTPKKAERQTMLFSATLTPEVQRMAVAWSRDAVSVEIEPEQVAVDTVEQIIYITTSEEKFALLYNYIILNDLPQVLVFCNRKDETRRLARQFGDYGIQCAILSGDVPQKKRVQTLANFKAGKIRLLVATDVAGRGIHIEGMAHVVNYHLPQDPEDYVHRIGRTGRAGATGTSISFACEDDSFYIPPIEKYLGRELHCVQPPAELLQPPPEPPPKKKRPPRRRKSAPKSNAKPGGGKKPDEKRTAEGSQKNDGRKGSASSGSRRKRRRPRRRSGEGKKNNPSGRAS